jgi:hypothetical protein
MYELYQSTKGSRGSLAEVWIDKDANLVKKYYKLDGCTISGKPPVHSDIGDIKKLYENEVYWSTALQSKHVVRMLEHGQISDDIWFILQDYHGTDLLPYYRLDTRLYHMIPDVDKQIEEMFEFWQAMNVYKINNAMANMTLADGKIKAFDFKYARHRSDEHRQFEQTSIINWISKIEPSLVSRLERLL